MSFGFSVGDLIAASRLAAEVHRAVLESHGASKDLKETLRLFSESQKAVADLEAALDLRRTLSQSSTDQKDTSKRLPQDPRQVPYSLCSTVCSIGSENGLKKRTPWQAKNVLCFDSGGVRNISSLVILRDLMIQIGALERSIKPRAETSADSPMVDTSTATAYLPCHYFDFVAGTSTGGLIAIMLGRMRMNIEDAMEMYEEIIPKLYDDGAKSRIWTQRLLLRSKSQSKEKRLRSALEKIAPEGKVFRSDETMCRTIVCSLQSDTNHGSMIPYLITSYNQETLNAGTHHQTTYSINLPHSTSSLSKVRDTATAHSTSSRRSRSEGSHSMKDFHVWEVARATSCSPLYFKPLRLGEYKYFDASISLCNPSLEVYREVDKAASEHDGNQHLQAVNIFLSLGCGNSSSDAPSTFFQDNEKLGRAALRLSKALANSSESVHNKMQGLRDNTGNFSYYRFDAKEGLEGLRAETSSSSIRRRIKEATEAYLNDSEVRKQLEELAEKLVRLRRLRCNTSRWEAYAFGTRYKCEHRETCEFKTKHRVVERDELLDHLRIDHDMPPPDSVHYYEIKTLVKMGRTDSD